MKRLSLLAVAIGIAVAILAPTASASTAPLQSLAGRWTGTLDGVKPKIVVTIDLTGQWNGSRTTLTGNISCSGRLTFVGKGSASYRFSEHITKNTSPSCELARGRVVFTPLADGRLDYAWKLIGGGQSSTATLSRSLT